MKKPVCILLICLASGMAYAFHGTPKTSPTVDNTSIRKSEKAGNKQVKDFSYSRYSSIVNSRKSKAMRKQKAKATCGEGSGL